MMFCIYKRYNGKTGSVLNNQQLKITYPNEGQRVSNLCFSLFLIVKKRVFPVVVFFFPLGRFKCSLIHGNQKLISLTKKMSTC